MSADVPSAGEALLAEVPRDPFIRTRSGSSMKPATASCPSRHTDPDRWHALVSADGLVVTQVNFGEVQPGQQGPRSWAQLDANLNDSAPFTVRQLGPRKLWDEAEAAYDWWYEQGEPGLDRFGFEIRNGKQWVWLDEPGNVVRI